MKEYTIFDLTDLFEAVKQHDVSAIEACLENPAIINSQDGHEKEGSALHVAARIGDDKVVEFLLKRDADIEAQNYFKETALHIAAKEGHGNVVRLLLKWKANIEAKDNDDYTPLHEAVIANHFYIVKLLLHQRANIEAMNMFGQTVLDTVTLAHCPKIAKILFDYHASIHSHCKQDGKIILEAISQKYPLLALYYLTSKLKYFDLTQANIECLVTCSVNRYVELHPIRKHDVHYIKYQLLGFFKDPQFGYPFFKLLFPALNQSEKQFNFQSLSNEQKILIAYCMGVPFQSLAAQLKKLYAKETVWNQILVKCIKGDWNQKGSHMDANVKGLGNIQLPQEIIDHIVSLVFPSAQSGSELFIACPLYPLYADKDLKRAYQILLGKFRHWITAETLEESTYNAIQAECRAQSSSFLQNDAQDLDHRISAMRM